MARVDRQAARIVALHDRVHGWKSEEPGLNEAFLQFLEAWMPHCDQTQFHLRLPPEHSAVKRSIHIFAEYDADKQAVLVTLEVNDTYRREEHRNTVESLREAALLGDTGRLSEDGLWLDPRFQGVLKMFVWWGNEKLWRHCAPAGRRASRLAFETLSGQSWEQAFGSSGTREDPLRIARIREEAQGLPVAKRPYAIPLRVLRTRGDLSMTQAIAAYLVEENGLSWQAAAAATGTAEWRTLYSALRDRDLKRDGKKRPSQQR